MSSPEVASLAKKQGSTFQNMVVSALALATEDAPSGVEETKWRSITELLHSMAKALEHVAGHNGVGPSVVSPSPLSSTSNQSLSHPTSSLPSTSFSSIPSPPLSSSDDPVETHLRARSLVISGIPEANSALNLEERLASDTKSVGLALAILQVEASPQMVYRMGKLSDKPRLLKVVLPSRSHLLTALKNAHVLRKNDEFKGIFIRKSQTREERERGKEMRDALREMRLRDSGCPFVLYRDQLWHKDDIRTRKRSRIPPQGN